MHAKTPKSLGIILLALFVLFTILVKTVDVAPVGPEGSSVGLAGMNQAFHTLTGYQTTAYTVSKYTGYVALLLPVCMTFYALLLAVRRQKGQPLDRDLWFLIGLYAVVAVIYVFFEKFIINYRPVILNPAEGLEASYPSSHTLIAICVFVSAADQFRRRIRMDALRKAAVALCYLLMAVIILCRLISGVHWLTDILASLLLGSGLVLVYLGLVNDSLHA